jgi:hypothetical protein
VGLDKLSPLQMAAWLRETAANTRKHSDPAWCAARALPYDPVAAHVAFRIEQAATSLVRLHEAIDAHNKGCAAMCNGKKDCGYLQYEHRR